ncbi:hypothetical protein AWJ20_2924 [Sugiyamaella lignohabitans]|uniref:DUF2470 domain-containing protein n=1 Tax=Sugiyamaella lignohabitans TaxID=796027 RepID=A0A161HMV7_9ASCO|nr:uncharacterized protein AWJ20_2924 [Sugiyamaella lignohabitans]ANB15297.1 hypothetical protein AWJ20_2924 [Sugiyamaella lignohabitans]
MPEAEAVVRKRIIKHMNDQKFRLFDYLEYFKGIKLNRSKDDVAMTAISLTSMELTYKKSGGAAQTTTLPISPPLSSYNDARHSLILLAKEAAGSLGYSAYQVTRYVPPHLTLTDLVPGSAVPLYILLTFFPARIVPYIARLSPRLASFLGRNAPKVLVGLIVFHIIEIVTILRPRLIKYRVPCGTSALWIVSNLFEGYPSFRRFDEEVDRINH